MRSNIEILRYDEEIEKYLARRKQYKTTKHNWKICFLIIMKYELPVKPRGYSAMELGLILISDYITNLNSKEKDFINDLLGV